MLPWMAARSQRAVETGRSSEMWETCLVSLLIWRSSSLESWRARKLSLSQNAFGRPRPRRVSLNASILLPERSPTITRALFLPGLRRQRGRSVDDHLGGRQPQVGDLTRLMQTVIILNGWVRPRSGKRHPLYRGSVDRCRSGAPFRSGKTMKPFSQRKTTIRLFPRAKWGLVRASFGPFSSPNGAWLSVRRAHVERMEMIR